MGIVESISVQQVSPTYRGAEGAPGSLLEPGSWVAVSGFGVSDAFWAEALLRQSGPAFHHFQLLPAVAAVEDSACSRLVCGRVGKSPRRVGISPGRLRADARACAL